jgi:glucose/arabinose dehydrogenase
MVRWGGRAPYAPRLPICWQNGAVQRFAVSAPEEANMLIDRLRKLFLCLFMTLFAACGGGGGGPGVPGPVAPPVATTGSLTLTLSNLPVGATGAVRVTGPNNFAQDVTASQTLSNLAPGTYSITAKPVAVGAATWTPAPAMQSAVVVAGGTVTAAVVYSTAALSLALSEVANGLDNPVFLAAPPGDPRQFIVERTGRIRILQDGNLRATPFLDIGARVATDGEGGLLSLAFDPQYASNGYFYVYFTDPQHNIVVERYRAGANPNLADPTSALAIIHIAHPQYVNHFGGLVAFGPDGYLYLGTGDGGGGGDPQGNAQNLSVLLGKMLRLDVSAARAGQPYTIPPTNPFAAQPGRRAEIWAWGLRNPWRFAFDGAQLYIADVGEARREEVDIAAATLGGLNYGWNTMEGSLCFGAASCDRTGLTLPAFDYDHGVADANGCAITGGYVYRGSALPELAGRYFYSDYCGGYLKSFHATGAGIVEQRDWGVRNIGAVVSFGRDGQGELYLIAQSGRIYKIGRATSQ